jgi:hypothetical protein
MGVSYVLFTRKANKKLLYHRAKIPLPIRFGADRDRFSKLCCTRFLTDRDRGIIRFSLSKKDEGIAQQDLKWAMSGAELKTVLCL